MVHEEGIGEDLQKETDRLLASFAPASVVIDGEMEILHSWGYKPLPETRPPCESQLQWRERAGFDCEPRFPKRADSR